MNEVTIGNMPTLPYAVEEAVNRLRINISFLGSDIKKIMVISTMTDEGKSFVTMQLWRQMAESGTPSILLDADLRKSVMTDKYDITMNDGSEVWGTSYILAHDIPIQDAVLHTQISGGDILPNVKNVVNPSMLMESKQFENMLNTMADMYRYVFIDAPPLNLVSDGEKIGSLCDGAILVVRGGFTQKKMVRNSIRQLERAGCPVLGIVLNRVGGNRGSYYYKKYGGKKYGYGYGYGYYGSNSKGNEYYYASK